MSSIIRRTVPNDNSCLFWALGYVGDGGTISRTRATELRDLCAQDVLKDPDPATRALLLDADSVEQYVAWIRNEHNWGGENEILTLAKHYKVEVAVVCCESLQVMCYGSDNPLATERVYLLYTGQHYDPLVAGASKEALLAEEKRRFIKGDKSLEKMALEEARSHNREAARKALQKRVKRIKCLGCGSLCDDNEAFARHCSEVEHDDDFAFECDEVEVVIEGGEALPDGAIDLASETVHAFYNTEQEPLSSSFPAPVELSGLSFPTLEHFWQAAPFLGRDAELVSRIRRAPNAALAVTEASGAGPTQDPSWSDRRESVRLEAERARALQNPNVAAAILATGEKMIVLCDPNPWAGMAAPGGIAVGQNHVGKALMKVREELRAK